MKGFWRRTTAAVRSLLLSMVLKHYRPGKVVRIAAELTDGNREVY
jgi:hypothetical protein